MRARGPTLALHGPVSGTSSASHRIRSGHRVYRYPYGAFHEATYVNGSRNGPFRYVHEHGQVLREGFYKDGLYDGSLTTRNTKGEVLDVSEFVRGTGTYRIFYCSGQIAQEAELRSAKRHGLTRKWNGRWAIGAS